MKKSILCFVCIIAVMMSCKNKGQAGDATELDSTAIDSVMVELNDTTPLPMFLYYLNPQYMQMVYWTSAEEPQKNADNVEFFPAIHREWARQDMFRRNAAGYTKMRMGENKWVDIKYIGEILKNPDGETMYGGELHSRPSIPSPGLRYAFANNKDIPKGDDTWGLQLVIHQNYQKSRKQLDCEYTNKEIPMPQSIVKKMEQRYGMKSKRSQLCTKIGGRYTQGIVQFVGEYKDAPKDPNVDFKRALALEVIADGDSIYSLERLGYYDAESKECTWNADDGGEYTPTLTIAAFEGPKGLEICYAHYAPESSTVGMFFLNDGKINDLEYACYHNMMDEPTPLWKKDIAQLQKLYLDNAKGNKDPLTKYQFLFIDEDNIEEIWMRTKDDMHGAVFTMKEGKPQLIATEDDKSAIAFHQGNGKGSVQITREEGAFTTTKLFVIKGSQVVDRFSMKELDGEITDATLNGKTLTKWEAADFLDKSPSNEYKPYIYWIDIQK